MCKHKVRMTRATGNAGVDGTTSSGPGGQAASVPLAPAACAKETTSTSRERSPVTAEEGFVPGGDVDSVSMDTDPSSQTDEEASEANDQLEATASFNCGLLQYSADQCNNFYDLPGQNENVTPSVAYCHDPRCGQTLNEEPRSSSRTVLPQEFISSLETPTIVSAYRNCNRNMISPEPPSGSEESLLPRSEPQSPAPWPSQGNSCQCPADNMYHDALLMRPPVPHLMDIDLIRFGPTDYDYEDANENGGLLPHNRMCSGANSASYHCSHGHNIAEFGNVASEDMPTCAQRCFTLTAAAATEEADEEAEAYDVCEAYDLFLDVYLPKHSGLPQVKSAAEISVASSVSQKSLPICRICHLPANDDDQLISPCRCAGTMQFIHSSCLMKWLEISNKRSKRPPSCELCLYQYHRHKKFKANHWQFPSCSNRDKVLHVIFVVSLLTMIGCASATIMCFKHDKGMRSGLDKTELTRSEVVTLVCGVLFFIAFFVAMYVEVKSRNTIYKLLVSFVYLNQQWYIDEYDKKKDLQPVPV